ncbi:hypothetical protein ABTZ78_17805, partial [Streptomyces bauhiniae]|uniref:hypothetical protein n=1 Tax=Streptomyces bauhiniae TaxID=2340725 RepID=UPI003322D731
THPLGLSSGLPFGVSDSIRSFSDPISSVLSRSSLSRFPFRRFRLYQKLSAGLTGFIFRFIGGCFSEVAFSDVLKKPDKA